MRRLILSFLYAIMFWEASTLLFLASPAFAQTAKIVAARSFPSIVLLLMEDSKGQPYSLGSGFFVQGNFIATNAHVIKGATRGTAKLIGRPEKGEILGVVAADPLRDLALLQVKGITAPALPIGESGKVSIGEELYAVGNPHGLEGTVSQGIVSGIRKISETEILQITAPISPGSSGGPVLDQQGKVIGVAVATFKGGQNLNFAIPSAYLAALISQPKSLVPLSSIITRKDSKSAVGELGGKAVDGVLGSSLTCKPDIEYIRPDKWECSFSLVNTLRSPVRNVHYLVILYSKTGEPLDTRESSHDGAIRPGLAIRPWSFTIPHEVKQITSRIEIRVLGFIVDESS